MRRSAGALVVLVAVLVAASFLRRPSEEAPVAPPVAVTTPEAPPPKKETPPGPAAPARSGPTLAIAVLRASADRVAVVDWADKSIPYVAPELDSTVRWRVEEPATGRVLAEGPVALPALCSCPIGHDHPRGCVLVRHQAVVRLNLPRLVDGQRLRIVGPAGELGSVVMEVRS